MGKQYIDPAATQSTPGREWKALVRAAARRPNEAITDDFSAWKKDRVRVMPREGKLDMLTAVIDAMLKEGAASLGKTNLSEWGNFRGRGGRAARADRLRRVQGRL